MTRWSTLITLPVAGFIVLFAIANRQWVVLSLDPFSADSPAIGLSLPLWAVAFGGLFIGVLIGWLASVALRARRSLSKFSFRRVIARPAKQPGDPASAGLPAITPGGSNGAPGERP